VAERRQQKGIDYLSEEDRVLRLQIKGRKLRLTDGQRRRLAVKGRSFGRKLLEQVALGARENKATDAPLKKAATEPT
jgi:hypothetical protein